MKRYFHFLLIIVLSTLVAGCTNQDIVFKEKPVADLLLTNGRVYTANDDQPWVEAIAVRAGSIIFIGNQQDAEAYMGDSTEIIDLKGKMAMPGLIDGHVHPVLGSMELATQCLFSPDSSPDQIKATLMSCMEGVPADSWIVGGRWDSTFFRKHKITSPAEWLDQFSGDHPISLADDTGHNRWVNTKALNLVGINHKTRIPGGVIELDDQGKPNGLLLESAMYPVLAAIDRDLKPTPDQYFQAAKISLKLANEYGITGIKEAGDSDKGVIAYRKLDQAGELTARIETCIAVTLTAEGELNIEHLQRVREQNRSRHVGTDCAKLFLDGVPSEARTAAVLANYLPDPQGVSHNGTLLIKPEKLKTFLVQLDAMGITVKVHAAGDRAVRETLNAIERARQINGDSGLRHELAHSGFIAPEDIHRIVELNAVADMSPSIWYPSPITYSIIAAMGERGRDYWPFKDLLDAGAEVIAGTDWPAVVPNMNPWPGIEAMVTRKHPDNRYPGALWPEQAISLPQALDIHTINGARALNLEAIAGILKPGMSADIIVLNQNLFEIPPEQIGDTKVDVTFFKGKLVYERQHSL